VASSSSQPPGQVGPPFRVEFGCGTLADRSADFGGYVAVTTPTPWHLTGQILARQPERVQFIQSLEVDELDAAIGSLPPVDTVVGLGGGMAIDAAKYVAVSRCTRLYLVPTIASGNGPFTRNIAIRRGGVPVGSVADFTPEAVLVDYDVIRQARPDYNRSGISDVLSSYTALIDWRAAASAGQAEWRDDLAEVSRRMRAKVVAAASEIGLVSDAGIRTLMEAFAEGAESAASKPGQRMFTGSDHLFAWNLEATTGRHFLHGEVVGLGIILMYAFQGNDSEEPRRALSEAQVRYLPRELGVARDELMRTLVSCPAMRATSGRCTPSWTSGR